VQVTARFSLSASTHIWILTFPPTAAQYLMAVQYVRNAVCRDKDGADCQTAGRNINYVTEVTSYEGKPAHFR
jgi:hypothetical protein